MSVIVQVILAWILIGSILNLIAFRKGYYRWIQKLQYQRGYEEGYSQAAGNLRMYYAITGKLPSTVWVRQSIGHVLNTREKILSYGVEPNIDLNIINRSQDKIKRS